MHSFYVRCRTPIDCSIVSCSKHCAIYHSTIPVMLTTLESVFSHFTTSDVAAGSFRRYSACSNHVHCARIKNFHHRHVFKTFIVVTSTVFNRDEMSVKGMSPQQTSDSGATNPLGDNAMLMRSVAAGNANFQSSIVHSLFKNTFPGFFSIEIDF
jgi:hypothetical protein